jgi:hypothetical protein
LIKPLDEVLRYENAEVVDRFAVDHSVSVRDAEEIFLETKRWLWLCASKMDAAEDGLGARVPLLSEARVIDMMWHTFLLFTQDYARFCAKYFGFFVHHQPRTRVEKAAWERRVTQDPRAALEERRALLRGAYETVCDELGIETLRKWCDEFPARFTFDD